jgi:hypothetical protein
MSGDALKAVWEAAPIDWDTIESFRLAIPDKRRPSQHSIAIVDFALATFVIPSRGYADPTYEQILSRCPSIDSADTVKYALQVLSDAGRWVTVRRSCRGIDGMPGRAPQRVFFKHDPMNLIKEIDFPEDKVKASIEVVAVSKAYGKQVLATSRSNEKRINEIESEIADWRNSAERGTERAVNYAELRIKSLQEELEKELKNL